MKFGQTLKSAREAKGLTINQIADTTRLMPSMIEELENENFSKIVAPIYGRGYVKLIATQLDLDPKPLIDEFMAIYNGEKECEIKSKEIPAIPAELQVEQKPEPEPVVPTAPVAPAVPTAPAAPATPVAPANPEPTFSRYSTPIRHESSNFSIPPSFWRWSLLGGIAILILWGVIMALKALHSATTDAAPAPTPSAEIVETAKQPASTTPAKKVPATPRTPYKVGQLYID